MGRLAGYNARRYPAIFLRFKAPLADFFRVPVTKQSSDSKSPERSALRICLTTNDARPKPTGLSLKRPAFSVSAFRRGELTKGVPEEWGALMAAGQRGHAGAYRRLLGEVRDWLLRFYGRRLAASHVEDAVQDALLSMHEKRHTYDPSRPFKPWLAAIARYKWIDRLRAMHHHFDPLPDDISVPDHENTVMSSTMLSLLLAELPPAQQQVIKLVKVEGLSIEEASERTGQSASLVKVNIHRGLAKLAVIVQEYANAE